GTKTSTNTAVGAMNRLMGTSGVPSVFLMAGRRTVMDTGSTSRLGVGRGLKTSLGDLPRSTMVVGHTSGVDGAGFPDQSQCARCTRPRWLHSSAEADSTLA